MIGQAGQATLQPEQQPLGPQQAGQPLLEQLAAVVDAAAPTAQPAAPTATAAPTAQRAAPPALLQQAQQGTDHQPPHEQQQQAVTVQRLQQLKMLPPPVREEQCPPEHLQPQAPLPHGQPAAQQPQQAEPQPQQGQAQQAQQEVQAQEARPRTPDTPAPDQQLELLSREAPVCRAVLGSMFVARGQLERGLADVERLLLGECCAGDELCI